MIKLGRTERIAYAATIALAVILLILVDVFTIEYNPGKGMSGNGNPGVLTLLPLIPVCAILFIWNVRFGRLISACFGMKRIRLRYAGMIIALVTAGLLLAEFHFVQSQLLLWGGSWNEPESALYRFGPLNVYTNTLYANGYTGAIGYLLSLMAGMLWEKLRQQRKQRKHV